MVVQGTTFVEGQYVGPRSKGLGLGKRSQKWRKGKCVRLLVSFSQNEILLNKLLRWNAFYFKKKKKNS